MGVWSWFLANMQLPQKISLWCLPLDGTLTHRCFLRDRFPEKFCVNQLTWGRHTL